MIFLPLPMQLADRPCDDEQMPSRVAVVRVALVTLEMWIKGTRSYSTDLPADATIKALAYDEATQVLSLLVWSASFPAVPDGERAVELNVTITVEDQRGE